MAIEDNRTTDASPKRGSGASKRSVRSQVLELLIYGVVLGTSWTIAALLGFDTDNVLVLVLAGAVGIAASRGVWEIVRKHRA